MFCLLVVQHHKPLHGFDFFFATIVVYLELLEYNIPVEEVDGEGHQAAATGFGGVSLAGMCSHEEEEGLVPLEETTPATLSHNPRSLHLLWQEYKFGINDRKPAEQFTREERNKKENKQKSRHFRTAEYDIKVGSILLAELSLRRSLF